MQSKVPMPKKTTSVDHVNLLHVLKNDKSRSFVDAIGVIPLVVGAFRHIKPEDKALYLDQPVFDFRPFEADVKSGKWVCHTGHALAMVQEAMKRSDRKMIDVLKRVMVLSTPELTKQMEDEATKEATGRANKEFDLLNLEDNPADIAEDNAQTDNKKKRDAFVKAQVDAAVYAVRARIEGRKSIRQGDVILKKVMDRVTAVEKRILADLKNKKGSIAQCNANLRLLVVKVLNSRYTDLSTTDKEEMKTMLRVMISDDKISQGKSYSNIPLHQYGDSDPFNALEGFEDFFTSYIAKANPDFSPLKTKFVEQELLAIDNAIHAISACHTYYDHVMQKLHFGVGTADVFEDWTDLAHPSSSQHGEIVDSAFTSEGSDVVCSFLWRILAERTELLSNVVNMYCRSFNGSGSKFVNGFASKFVDCLIFHSVIPIFESSTHSFKSQVGDELPKKNPVMDKILRFGMDFEGPFAWFMTQMDVTNVFEVENTFDADEIERNIRASLLQTAGTLKMGCNLSYYWKPKLQLTELIIPSVENKLKNTVDDRLKEIHRELLHIINVGSDLDVLKYVPYEEHERLRENVCKEVGADLMSGFASYLITALNIGNGIFASRFIFNKTLNTLTGRSAAAARYFIATKHPFKWVEDTSQTAEINTQITTCMKHVNASMEAQTDISKIPASFQTMYKMQQITYHPPPAPTPRPLSRGQSAGGKPPPKKSASHPANAGKQQTPKAQTTRPQSAPAAPSKASKKKK